MLAQSFLKPEALGITEEEHRALIKVLGMLEREELRHAPDPAAADGNCFNMGEACHKAECGTAACIGGWVAIVLGKPDASFYVDQYMEKGTALYKLYWGPILGTIGAGNITPAQAAIALRNYLTTGEPRWDEALAGD